MADNLINRVLEGESPDKIIESEVGDICEQCGDGDFSSELIADYSKDPDGRQIVWLHPNCAPLFAARNRQPLYDPQDGGLVFFANGENAR